MKGNQDFAILRVNRVGHTGENYKFLNALGEYQPQIAKAEGKNFAAAAGKEGVGGEHRNNTMIRNVQGSSGRAISKESRVKLDQWLYKPSDELYLKYQNVFDNPKYYNQSTGEIIWPQNDGFVARRQKVELKKGTRIDRYGYDSGRFASPEGISFGSRALAPGSDLKPYNVFIVEKPFSVEMGEIAPWFDEIGGGIQYCLPKTIEKLIENGFLRRILVK